jgi:SagB-type dehydrogenase family enzyme
MTEDPTTEHLPETFAQLRSFSYGATPINPAPVGIGDLAEEFHEASKIRSACPARSFGPAGNHFQVDPDTAFRLGRKTLAHTGDALMLPRPEDLKVDLTEVVTRRRSALPEQPGTLSLDQLGTILGLSAASAPHAPGRRMYPSAGALYPLDVVAAVSAVDRVRPGHYVYDPIEHALLRRGEISAGELHERASLHTPTAPAAVTFAIAATFARTRAKYGLRGYRFALLEAGHLAQSVVLAATALGLASLPWGGYADAEVDRALDLDGLERSCLYLVSVSAPTAEGRAA